MALIGQCASPPGFGPPCFELVLLLVIKILTSCAVNLLLIIKAFLKSSSRRDPALGRVTHMCCLFIDPPYPLSPTTSSSLTTHTRLHPDAPLTHTSLLLHPPSVFLPASDGYISVHLRGPPAPPPPPPPGDVWSAALPLCDYRLSECAVPGRSTGRPAVTKNQARSAAALHAPSE